MGFMGQKCSMPGCEAKQGSSKYWQLARCGPHFTLCTRVCADQVTLIYLFIFLNP